MNYMLLNILFEPNCMTWYLHHQPCILAEIGRVVYESMHLKQVLIMRDFLNEVLFSISHEYTQ